MVSVSNKIAGSLIRNPGVSYNSIHLSEEAKTQGVTALEKLTDAIDNIVSSRQYIPFYNAAKEFLGLDASTAFGLNEYISHLYGALSELDKKLTRSVVAEEHSAWIQVIRKDTEQEKIELDSAARIRELTNAALKSKQALTTLAATFSLRVQPLSPELDARSADGIRSSMLEANYDYHVNAVGLTQETSKAIESALEEILEAVQEAHNPEVSLVKLVRIMRDFVGKDISNLRSLNRAMVDELRLFYSTTYRAFEDEAREQLNQMKHDPLNGYPDIEEHRVQADSARRILSLKLSLSRLENAFIHIDDYRHEFSNWRIA